MTALLTVILSFIGALVCGRLICLEGRCDSYLGRRDSRAVTQGRDTGRVGHAQVGYAEENGEQGRSD